MTKKTRSILFYSFLFLFVFAGLYIIFSSQGWQLDINNCRIPKLWNCQITLARTGGIFIATKPKGVVIKIDGEIFKDNSGLIQSGTLINDLLPKDYKVEIEKDGYLPWEKNILVGSGLVAELLKIVLIPEEINKKTVDITKSIDDFWINQQQKIIFKNKGGIYYFSNPSPTNESDNLNIKLRGDKFIQWSEDGGKTIIEDSKNQIYYLYDLNNLSEVLNVSAVLNNLQKTDVSGVAFYPIESSKLIVKDKKGLSLLDLNRFKLENLVNALAWTMKSPNIYYIEETQDQGLKTKRYQLANFNLISKTSDVLVDLPVNSATISDISASDGKIVFLTKDGGLYLFNRETKSFKQIAHSAEKFAFSYDNKKIAFLDKNGKLNIYFLDDYRINVNKKAGEIISVPFYEKGVASVKNIFWYKDSHHLFVDYLGNDGKERIDFVEIDDRLPINKYTLVENASNFYYEPNSNYLYFIQNNSLYFIEI